MYDTQKATFDVVVARLMEFAGEQVAGQRLSQAEVRRNKALRRELRERHLAPISQIARALLADAPGIERALRMPAWALSSTRLVAEAQAMRTAAQTYADVFVQNGRPASFLEDLDAAREAVRQTVLGKARNIGRSAGRRRRQSSGRQLSGRTVRPAGRRDIHQRLHGRRCRQESAMKRGGGVHTVPALESEGWWNKVDGEVVTRHRLKETAVEAGREIAIKLQVEHTIHNSDGVIAEKNSYGNDPFPPRDS